MTLESAQIGVLEFSARELLIEDVAPYFRLRSFLSQSSPRDRKVFEREFARFYGLNAAGVSDRFRRAYFDELYAADPASNDWPNYHALLERLYAIPNRRGKRVLQSSFVSKLVAAKDESKPLFDIHVARFFGFSIPSVGSTGYRAEMLTSHLDYIGRAYRRWARTELSRTLQVLRKRIPELRNCNDVRLCDFLVWTAGRKKLTNGVK